MSDAAERERILAVLYDLSMTIGGESGVAGLTATVLQRFLYHTGYPAGFMAQRLDWGRPDQYGSIPVRLEMAVGDHKLLACCGAVLALPLALLDQVGGCVDDANVLGQIPARKPFQHALVLPVPGYGSMVLLAHEQPRQILHYSMFTPILDRLFLMPTSA